MRPLQKIDKRLGGDLSKEASLARRLPLLFAAPETFWGESCPKCGAEAGRGPKASKATIIKGAGYLLTIKGPASNLLTIKGPASNLLTIKGPAGNLLTIKGPASNLSKLAGP